MNSPNDFLVVFIFVVVVFVAVVAVAAVKLYEETKCQMICEIKSVVPKFLHQ